MTTLKLNILIKNIFNMEELKMLDDDDMNMDVEKIAKIDKFIVL